MISIYLPFETPDPVLLTSFWIVHMTLASKWKMQDSHEMQCTVAVACESSWIGQRTDSSTWQPRPESFNAVPERSLGMELNAEEGFADSFVPRKWKSPASEVR